MPMPKDDKVEQTTHDASDKIRQKTIKEGLSEIYQDEDGEIIDVQKLSIKPKRRWWFWLAVSLSYLAALGLVAYLIVYFVNRSTDAEAVELAIEADKKVITGQEFYYIVQYQNLERVGLQDIMIRLDYPENFIYLDADPLPTTNNNIWELTDLGPHRGGEIRIKGKILAPANKQNIILGEMTYQPDNFTSQFKKVASFENIIADTGIELDIVSPASAMVGEEQRIIVKYQAKEEGYLDNFRLTVIPTALDNIVLMSQQQNDKITEIEPWTWQVEGIDKTERELVIRFRFKDKVNAQEVLKMKFDYRYDPTKELMAVAPEATETTEETISETALTDKPKPVYYTFAEMNQEIEVVKNDLNLTLIINGSDNDQSVDFGQTLNYSINYSNKGDSDMEDIVIMAVLEGELLDWSSLTDNNRGIKKNNTITWTKSQIPQLSSLSPKEKGNIDFSIAVQSAEEARTSNVYKGNNQIKSYVQFQIMADDETPIMDQSNMSNVIINNVNSDLQLIEQVRYFNNDNIAVGTGPLPPKVGETTTLKVYWQIDNTLHDLNNVQVSSQLPAYVVWGGKEQANVGNIHYDASKHLIIWEIDYLPININKPQAEFNIQITPTANNLNQIIILLNGTKIVAEDAVTEAEISRINPAKTSKLEDDVMIDNDGVVR